MKKIVSLLMIVVLLTGVFAGCNKKEAVSASNEEEIVVGKDSVDVSVEPLEEESLVNSISEETIETEEELPALIRVGAMKGPTAMGMVQLMQSAEQGETENTYEFTLGVIDEMVALLAKGELDFAAIPANLASVLYHNTEGKVKVIAVNTLGVLYVVGQGGTVQSIEDLKGKTLYATGKGATPELALNYVLEKHNIDPATDLTIEFKAEPSEIIPLLLANPEAVALLPQPFVTVAQTKVEGLDIALDWTKEWDAVADGGSNLLTGVVVVQAEFAAKYPEAVATFVQEYALSTAYTESNPTEAAELIEQYGIVDAAIAEKALPFSNIVCIVGEEMKTSLQGYLEILLTQDPKSVGGELPDDEFYYIAK